MKTQSTAARPKRKGISYAKWGYLFILPFFVTYCIFALVPQLLTIYNSFFENYREDVPLMMAHGVGANGSRSLATGVIGGMIVGTLALP